MLVKPTYYQVGNYLQFKKSSVIKVITEVRETGYSWNYPYGDVSYSTDNEVDKFLEDGYHLYEETKN